MNHCYNILNFIKKKRKQIIFALFAVLCYVLDNNDSIGLLKAGVPAVVAAASTAKNAATATKTAKTVASTAKTASNVANTTNKTANVVNNAAKSTVPNTRNVSKNINPNSGPKPLNNLSSDSISNNIGETSTASELIDEKKDKKNNLFNPQLDNSNIEEDIEEDEEVVTMESASEEIFQNSSKYIVGYIFGAVFLLIFSVPIIILLFINPSTSAMSQIDCSMQESSNCIEEESSILNKLKNLFAYGAYGSNSEVVVKELEDSYNKIKEEHDFIINLPLLSSSMFSDSEYINTKIENDKIVITDEMLKRTEYIYQMAELQMIPKFHIYTCSHSSYYDEYEGGYKSSYSPIYQYTTEDEESVENIPTGECNYMTVGSTYKMITYYFNEEKYFERLKDSEELDLVYSSFIESDEMLVSKIKNQYQLYKSVNQIPDVSEYDDVPIHLEYDSNVNLQAPLKGWYSITSPFGNREGEYAGMHTGIDLVASDKNIYAAGTGVVTRSNVETEGGNVVEITHTTSNGTKYVTQYAHLSERLVNLGDTVNSGDVIGIMGDTGTMASGVHLHFSVWQSDPYELLNPRKLFSEASNY